MDLDKANKIMGIVNEHCQKVVELKEKLEDSRWKNPKHQLIYEGVNFCYFEMLDMQDKLEKLVLSGVGEE